MWQVLAIVKLGTSKSIADTYIKKAIFFILFNNVVNFIPATPSPARLGKPKVLKIFETIGQFLSHVSTS